jgi:hypothetical protein
MQLLFDGYRRRRSPFPAGLLLIFTIPCLLACAPFRVGNIRVGYSAAGHIAMDCSLPGKCERGQCLTFALALHEKFAAAGIPSKVIAYGYEALSAPTAGVEVSQPARVNADGSNLTGAHAVVAYNDDGRIYMMDNQSWRPTWVHDAGAMAMAQQFSGMNTRIRGAQTFGPRYAAELEKTALKVGSLEEN